MQPTGPDLDIAMCALEFNGQAVLQPTTIE